MPPSPDGSHFCPAAAWEPERRLQSFAFGGQNSFTGADFADDPRAAAVGGNAASDLLHKKFCDLFHRSIFDPAGMSISGIQSATGNDIYIARLRKSLQFFPILPAAGVGAIHHQIAVHCRKFITFSNRRIKIVQPKIIGHAVRVVHEFRAVSRSHRATFPMVCLIAQINKKVFVRQDHFNIRRRYCSIHTLNKIRHLSTPEHWEYRFDYTIQQNKFVCHAYSANFYAYSAKTIVLQVVLHLTKPFNGVIVA